MNPNNKRPDQDLSSQLFPNRHPNASVPTPSVVPSVPTPTATQAPKLVVAPMIIAAPTALPTPTPTPILSPMPEIVVASNTDWQRLASLSLMEKVETPVTPKIDPASPLINSINMAVRPLNQPPRIEQPTVQVPVRPIQQQSMKSGTKSSMKWVVTILVLIILVAGGMVAYAYYEKIGPFTPNPPYNTNTMASSIFAGIGNIGVASYSLHMNAASQTKEADAKPFELAVDNSEQTLAYKKDIDTVRDIQVILTSIETYFSSKKKYPSTLPKDITISSERLSQCQYQASSSLSDYTLTVHFQSVAAINSIIKSINMYSSNASTTKFVASGKTLTFTKNIMSSYLYISSEPPQPFLANILGMQDYLGNIPSDFMLDGTLSGATAKTASNQYDSQVRISGSANYSDISAAVDAQFKKIGNNIYIMVSKFPTIVASVSKIKDKWIVLTPQDIASYASGYMGSTSGTPNDQIEASKGVAIQAIKVFLIVADLNQALIVKNKPAIELINGIRAYRYELEFNKQTMPKFYSDLTTRFASQFKDKNPMVFDQGTLDYLKSKQFSDAFDYFRNNTTLVLWADSTGIPVQVMYKIRMVPGIKAKNSDRQIVLTTTLSLNDINKTINIETPKDSMSMEDAIIAITGQSKEEYIFNKQQASITTIRTMLGNFKSIVGIYPESIGELIKETKGVKGTYTPRVTILPVDAYTGKSFDYTKSSNDYTLKYRVILPAYATGTISVGIYTFDYANRASVKLPLILTAVNGLNTADSKTASLEAVSQSKLDTDKDGAPDALEKYLGTNPNKKDTDADGYSDYDELMKGSDPLGPGNLKASGSIF